MGVNSDYLYKHDYVSLVTAINYTSIHSFLFSNVTATDIGIIQAGEAVYHRHHHHHHHHHHYYYYYK